MKLVYLPFFSTPFYNILSLLFFYSLLRMLKKFTPNGTHILLRIQILPTLSKRHLLTNYVMQLMKATKINSQPPLQSMIQCTDSIHGRPKSSQNSRRSFRKREERTHSERQPHYLFFFSVTFTHTLQSPYLFLFISTPNPDFLDSYSVMFFLHSNALRNFLKTFHVSLP